MLSKTLVKKLKKLSKRLPMSDESRSGIYEESGGYYDDAWNIGFNDGESSLAKEILKDLEKN